MKNSPTFFAALLLSTAVVFAGAKPQQGTIVSQTSVSCGAKKSKKQDIDLLCQQYVVRSGSTDYTIRQPKPSDQTLIRLNASIQFTLDKNKMKFKADGKSYEFIVVSQAAVSSAAATPVSSAPNRQEPVSRLFKWWLRDKKKQMGSSFFLNCFLLFELRNSPQLETSPDNALSLTGFDKPMKSSVVSPTGAPKPNLNTILTSGHSRGA
jgi:hypothetical protein